jgi:aminoglycoside/choline kinase family phosphotransferase
MPDAVSAYLAREHVVGASVSALTPDASDRRYFRIRPQRASTFVLAVMSGPFEYETLPFVNVADLFARLPVPVPRILGAAPDLGVLALDDLGDVTLQEALRHTTAQDAAALYREAVTLIGVIQRRGAELAHEPYLPYGLAFDVDKLMWEFRFFVTHFVEGLRSASLADADRRALDTEFASIATDLAAEPRVLCHRDYHSRNLMRFHDQLCIIDFQDARMGPDTYDLVSLLRDSYVDLPESLVVDLIDEFFDSKSDPTPSTDRRARFDLMATQRNIKALGTFGYQVGARGNAAFTDAIPRTLAHVRDNLYRYDRFARLRAVLARYIEELHP